MDDNLPPTNRQAVTQFVRHFWLVIVGVALLASSITIGVSTEHLRHTEKVDEYTTHRYWHSWDALTIPLFMLGLYVTLYGVKMRFPRLFRG